MCKILFLPKYYSIDLSDLTNESGRWLNCIMNKRFDVVIVGAALNGLAAVLALGGPNARRPLSVAIVDGSNPYDKISNARDARASALTGSTRRMFEALGVWDHISAHSQDMREIIITDGQPKLLQFGDVNKEQTSTACMIENHLLLEGLLKTVELSSYLTLLTGSAVAKQSFGPGLATLTLANGEQITCNLIVAADGAKSPIRQAANIELVGWSYDQVGLVASFEHELAHQGRAEEHFTSEGPFAVLPLVGNRSSIVWTKAKAEGIRLQDLSPRAFEAELQAQLGDHLGKIALIGKQQGYPLSMLFAKQFHGPRLALVGDAAHVIHPLAGLGLNLGLRDVAALAECVGDAHALGQDIGGAQVLERYSAWRRFDTVATALSMDGINRLFSNSNPGLRILRDSGLQAVNRFDGLKHAFEREAAGENGSLPRLMRGELV
jgi:2-octaprenyl-6-methoxyphenol hydroxylase